MGGFVKEQAVSWFKNLGRSKKVVKDGKINGNYDILTVDEKQVKIIGNKTKRRS